MIKIPKIRLKIKKSKIIVYDSNLQFYYIEKLKIAFSNQFQIVSIRDKDIYLVELFLSIFYINKFNGIRNSYIYQLINESNCNKLISFNDTDSSLFYLSKRIPNVSFVIFQNSFRNEKFYQFKLKNNDILFHYGIESRFQNDCLQKYLGQYKLWNLLPNSSMHKNISNYIFISQYRNINHLKYSKVDYSEFYKSDHLLLSQLLYSNLLSKNQFFIKSSLREGLQHKITEEQLFYKDYDLKLIKKNNIFDHIHDTLFFSVDSTMIFELISVGARVLIYPYRNSDDFYIIEKAFSQLIISRNFENLEQKINWIKNLDINEYSNIISKIKFDYKTKINLKKVTSL
jgi:surface carbohydrate biosynthesis protein